MKGFEVLGYPKWNYLVHNGYCQKVYTRKIGEAVIEILQHLANKE